MPLHSTGPGGTDTFPAVCAHTHLFPGAGCRVQGLPDPSAFAAEPRPIEVDLRFSDGVIADARLTPEDPAGPVLVVPAYTTGAGTPVAARAWAVRKLTRMGSGVELTIGGPVGA
ncbi:hypothetical protein [Streptomyces sp. NPDC001744]|uniref:hypothetical protein n=1 Tax=Streptomyces sp. NPDC001744 TaxID=3364606 RepID=UPI0036750DF9